MHIFVAQHDPSQGNRDNLWVFFETCFIKEIKLMCICMWLHQTPTYDSIPVACLPSNLTDGRSLKDGKLFCKFCKNRYFAHVKRCCLLLHWRKDCIRSRVINQTPRGDMTCPSFTDGFIGTPETRNVYL